MTYTKRIVCLANSRKMLGRCVAGIELAGEELGEWIRPISDRPSEELSIDDRRYQNGKDVQLLDLVDITFEAPRPHACQTENHVIDDGYYWVRAGTFRATDLAASAITKGPLWVDGYNSFNGRNDRIPLAEADRLSSSLLLVEPTSAKIVVAPGRKKRQIRIRFFLGTTQYCLTVTDPQVEAEFLPKEDGEYDYPSRIVMCVSLGEPFEGYRYKLAASVIPI